MERFRFLTAGSVDDGKSTLIGHLLHLVNAIKTDQYDQIMTSNDASQRVNYAFLTDGLSSEREQGITIDVSYKYFSTLKRRFIIADCPGHEEYTRNMFTGASTADLLILMINVENGIIEQTLRHLNIAQLLHIPNLVVCINKMDLVDFSEDAFNDLVLKFNGVLKASDIKCSFIPVSATHGDNLIGLSENMPWYNGPTLIDLLNTCPKRKLNESEACFPVQFTLDVKGEQLLLGNSFEGRFSVGDSIQISPNNAQAKIIAIQQFNKEINELKTGDYASLTLDTNHSIERGVVLTKGQQINPPSKQFEAKLCWMDEAAMKLNQSYLLKCATQEVYCSVRKTNTHNESSQEISLNTIFTAQIETNYEILTRPYSVNPTLGAFILIDRQTNQTVAGGTVL